MFIEEKNEGIPCKVLKCKYYDISYEQNCSAGDRDDNPFLPFCDIYEPERKITNRWKEKRKYIGGVND